MEYKWIRCVLFIVLVIVHTNSLPFKNVKRSSCQPCLCRSNSLVCRGMNLYTFPQIVSRFATAAEFIDVSNNNIGRLDAGELYLYPSLTLLDMTKNPPFCVTVCQKDYKHRVRMWAKRGLTVLTDCLCNYDFTTQSDRMHKIENTGVTTIKSESTDFSSESETIVISTTKYSTEVTSMSTTKSTTKAFSTTKSTTKASRFKTTTKSSKKATSKATVAQVFTKEVHTGQTYESSYTDTLKDQPTDESTDTTFSFTIKVNVEKKTRTKVDS